MYKGEVVGHVKKYSDRLMELRIKALDPKYRDKYIVDQKSEVSITSPSIEELRQLTVEEREVMLNLLKTAKDRARPESNR